ncbi:MAG: AAA family ATPase, partial [Oxalobacteraceae bacterium]
MRKYAGIKPKFAQEFTGFSGTPKMFRSRFRGETDDITRLYSAADIRKIRMSLIGVPVGTRRQQTIPPIINVRMAKGGTGKSTTASNVVACAAMMGYRTLVIDGDPQSSLSSIFGVDWVQQEVTHIGELMRRANTKNEPVRIREAVVPIYGDGMLDLIAADISMSSADGWMMQLLNREQAFVRLLEKEIDFFSEYD